MAHRSGSETPGSIDEMLSWLFDEGLYTPIGKFSVCLTLKSLLFTFSSCSLFVQLLLQILTLVFLLDQSLTQFQDSGSENWTEPMNQGLGVPSIVSWSLKACSESSSMTSFKLRFSERVDSWLWTENDTSRNEDYLQTAHQFWITVSFCFKVRVQSNLEIYN